MLDHLNSGNKCMMAVLSERLPSLPLTRARMALGLNRNTVYAHQWRAANDGPPKRCRKSSVEPNALTAVERETVVSTLNGKTLPSNHQKKSISDCWKTANTCARLVRCIACNESSAKVESDVSKSLRNTMQYHDW
jgi:hypothetical protein